MDITKTQQMLNHMILNAITSHLSQTFYHLFFLLSLSNPSILYQRRYEGKGGLNSYDLHLANYRVPCNDLMWFHYRHALPVYFRLRSQYIYCYILATWLFGFHFKMTTIKWEKYRQRLLEWNRKEWQNNSHTNGIPKLAYLLKMRVVLLDVLPID